MTASDIPEISHAQAGFGLAELLTSLAVELHETEGREGTARAAVRLARDVIPEADHAGLFLVERSGRVRALADTVGGGDAEVVLPVPGEELWSFPVSRVADLSALRVPDGNPGPDDAYEPAGWDVPAGTVGTASSGSALFLRLRGHRNRFSVLTLHAATPHAFAGDETIRLGRLVAAHIGLALEAADVQEQLTEAMHTRDVIGQATGILMGRLDIDAAQAFERLVRTSQKGNVKLRDIASRIVNATAGGRPE
ncbi:ANTAR domain-containing protein [Streptomyces candidus]|uniref:GAF domain-containing protein n=1 Tax=Streptomyces candidus TaxID=67283 RepID=A0A7X0HIV6_9ACTN|nr:ANTAR domain-containing protein [Streptomyces candidus]MBB6437182.1 GAF domain-containing protein [Streptomyces candidus]